MDSALILKGVVTGLILSVMLGPAFFMLLETSIRKGIRAALAFDAGVILGDIIYILIVYLFIQQVEDLAEGGSKFIIQLIGGVLFVAYGYIIFSKKVKPRELRRKWKKDNKPKDYWFLFVKGLLLNLANPLIVFYWFTVIAFGYSGSDKLSGFNMFVYISFVLGVFLTIDVLKIFGAKKLRPFITIRFLSSLNRIIGTILMVFGAVLVVHSVVYWLK